MLLARLVEVSAQVAATRSRLAKRDLIAGLLREAASAPTSGSTHGGAEGNGPEAAGAPAGGSDAGRSADGVRGATGLEVELAATYLSGTLRQRRTGIGHRSLTGLPSPAEEPSVDLLEVDAALEAAAALAGPGSSTSRRGAVTSLFGRLTAPEQTFLRGLVTGNMRQGALDAVMLESVAAAAGIPVTAVRRAAMFSGPTGPIAAAALTGGAEALADFTLLVGRPVRPMLASTAPDVAAGAEKVGPEEFAVDTKLDGIRIQVHKSGDEVAVFTRSLDDITDRLPEVVEVARSLPARDLILDGEALVLDEAGRPRPFQETASTTATHAGATGNRPFFFDLLQHEDESLLEASTRDRLVRLDQVVPPEHRVTRLLTDSPEAARSFFDEAVAGGQEGVVLKRLDSAYDAGRRGSGWVKVKPRHTLDLVVLAVEWGSGRRSGWLSNIHLGARDPAGDGFVMLGKTFKGMTDEILAWQTERFLGLETHREGHVVHVRPEQVVEIAFDGVQRSTRYPGGVALRFARVLGYRDDKTPDEVDSLETVRGHLG
ncbi:MAG: ATP-dependent ligase [Marmoricola sp.]|nr:ATP-dependent ligase [Marmoricola sp.]